MSTFLTQTRLVTKRELGALFSSPLFYVLCGIFFLLEALVHVLGMVEFARGGEGMTVNVTDSVVRPTFHTVHFFLLIQIPLLTMRVFSEDHANGMLDLLQTTPLRDWSLLVGKFLGTWIGLFLYVLATASFPLVTALFGSVEWPVVIGSLVALTLASAAYVAVGLLFSAVTESQVVAAVLSYVTLFMVVFASTFAQSSAVAPLVDAARHFSVTEHVTALLGGNVALMDIVYFPALAIVFLFMTARVLESRRWRA